MENTILKKETRLEEYFLRFREKVIGIDQKIQTPYGSKQLIYADWTASGRLYRPIEEKLQAEIGPFVANTHTEATTTGSLMTLAYRKAKTLIKSHVNAGKDDIILNYGTGMTGAVNKFQRILGYRYPEKLNKYLNLPEEARPVIFVSHMEHHSNHTSWLETSANVILISHDNKGLVDLEGFKKQLDEVRNAPIKIAAVTGASNVTGIGTPYHEIAEIIHQYGGLCFVDFACSAPYVNIDMHPENQAQRLDAIFFSPHKFLGGPGSTGVLIFNKELYHNSIPDTSGGGTVDYTNPWGERHYLDDIEEREDGGTPGFLQTIKAALAIQLKEEITVEAILNREKKLNKLFFNAVDRIPEVKILAGEHRDRLSVFSFYIEGIHFNLVVKLLNERFGIQSRGGCSCAGTYGHYLLNVDQQQSLAIKNEILMGNLHERPGWVRVSLHPTTTNDEVKYICNAIREIVDNHTEWEKDYTYDSSSNEYFNKNDNGNVKRTVDSWL